MYIEHPFKYDGVYYAKIDGEFIEITEEQAKVMLSFYRNSRNYEKRWSPKNTYLEDQKQDDVAECCEELVRELEEEDRVGVNEQNCKLKNKSKKRKMILQREMILDCVFSSNTEGITIQDLPDNAQLSVEAMVIEKFEHQKLYSMISMLAEKDQYIVRSVFFEEIPQVQLAYSLGITPQALQSRIKYILAKLRRMYE